jgi:hypothetical protein
MKTCILFLFLCISVFSYSQSQTSSISEASKANLELEELPEIVLTKIGEDFSVYLPDKNPDLSVQQLQKYFIAYNLGKDYEGYDNYLVMMKNEKGTLTATYNNDGKLVRVVEKYDDVTLPNEVIYSVLKANPGWGIVEDKYHYTQADGDIKKKVYYVTIKNGKQTKKLKVTPAGEIL